MKPFETTIAIEQIEKELGCELGAVFSEISEEPVAAASLAQVYKARLITTGELVAVKVQRPGVQELVSKDLYVLRRAAEVYQVRQGTNHAGIQKYFQMLFGLLIQPPFLLALTVQFFRMPTEC